MEVVSLEGLDSQMVLTVCLGLGGKEREALLEEEESFSKFFNLCLSTPKFTHTLFPPNIPSQVEMTC